MADASRSHPLLSSLRAFASAGLRPRTPLARAIVLILCFKLAAVVALRIYLANDEARLKVDEAAVSRLLGVAPR